MPQPYLNDTWLYNSSVYFCNSSWTSPTGCLTVRGGLYDPEDSSTSQKASDVNAAGGDPSDTARTLDLHIWESEWVNDEFSVGNATIDKFALGMPGFPIFDTYDTQSQFGLGINSTLLNALKRMDAITSRAYSWWWGVQGATTQTDGQIVFGGYDSGRIQGTNYTRPMSTPTYPDCNSGMMVTISDLVLTFPNSTKYSLLSPNQMTACILPDYPLILTMPSDTPYTRFEAATQTQSFGPVGGNGLAFQGVGYYPDNVYQGSLTISIGDSIDFEFPNELLVVPPTNVEQDGAIKANETVREIMLGPTSAALGNKPAILGRHFFQAAYLMVDYETDSFTLWNANTTSTTSRLVALNNCTSNETRSHTGGASSETSAAPSDASSALSGAGEGRVGEPALSSGAIAGIAVGTTCAVFAIAAAVVVFCFRRRAKANKSAGEFSSSTALAQYPLGGFPGTITKHEAMSGQLSELNAYNKPSELASDWKARHELDAPNWRSPRHPAQRSPAELGSP
ncbi:hypothetical protein M409DRAFT_25679 [Zasmidium cellare ATCC 36951]|uniref:Peptidase A1 domain-containing protein n=1 Tax=Zasmidium cellare ATCC 36951 TaxID=1080233 RepID=A0A6A6CDA3_ZASCE|nr:uncharacterized protein M409DRAFT_25679 [Zasmidium cellare ATCC 36951]KAF2163902.1 hypothetical protein M409DRAFT_25679 [Zasmidium cellare ATCC 36951]